MAAFKRLMSKLAKIVGKKFFSKKKPTKTEIKTDHLNFQQQKILMN